MSHINTLILAVQGIWSSPNQKGVQGFLPEELIQHVMDIIYYAGYKDFDEAKPLTDYYEQLKQRDYEESRSMIATVADPLADTTTTKTVRHVEDAKRKTRVAKKSCNATFMDRKR